MNIIGITHQMSGCGYHRILLPLGFMDDVKGYVTNVITDDKTNGWDILLFNRVCPYDTDLQETKQLLNCKIVMDIDDDWDLPPSHMNYYQFQELADRIKRNLSNADMVTVTNVNLLKKVLPYNSNSHVLPNALPFGRNQYHDERQPSDKIRIFWAGGATHERDIALLKNPIQKLKMHRHKIDMVIGGWNEDDEMSKAVWTRMWSSFTSGGQLPYTKIHALPPTQYMNAFEHGDIMLIPLEQSDWHSCKSNLKILEAASKRMPCVVSKVQPYSLDADAPVLWVEKQSDWFKHINLLVNDADARQEMGNKLYEWAKEKYNLTDINQKRRALYADLCKA